MDSTACAGPPAATQVRFRVGLFTDRRLSVVCKRVGSSADLSNHNHATPVELVVSRFPGGATSPKIPTGCEALLDVRFLIMQFLPFTSALHPQFSNVDSWVPDQGRGRKMQ